MIEIRDLTKRYGSFTALDHLNLSLEEGVVFGFVGANGAGKSTTFSILATLLSPTFTVLATALGQLNEKYLFHSC